MALSGNIKVGANTIANWEAVREAVVEGRFIYKCRVEYTSQDSIVAARWFFVMHYYHEGALVLAGKVMTEANICLHREPKGLADTWQDFCDNYGLNPYIGID